MGQKHLVSHVWHVTLVVTFRTSLNETTCIHRTISHQEPNAQYTHWRAVFLMTPSKQGA